jgi:vacuole morphology and inheritance protein 14
VIEKILNIFHKNRNLLNKMSQIIIKKLCERWNAEVVYTSICNKLLLSYVHVGEADLDLKFTSEVIESLLYLLITDQSLIGVRAKLKNYKYERNEKIAK